MYNLAIVYITVNSHFDIDSGLLMKPMLNCHVY